MEGVHIEMHNRGMKAVLTLETNSCPIGDIMKRISAAGEVADITVSDLPMEDIIASIFQKEASL